MVLDWISGHAKRMWLAFAASLGMAWLVGALAHLVLESTLERMRLPPRSAVLVEAAVAGTVTAVLVGVVLAAFWYRHEVVRKRLETVAELNHRVRNALEIISSSTIHIHDKQTVIAILEAVMRIDATLRGLFPPGEGPKGPAIRH